LNQFKQMKPFSAMPAYESVDSLGRGQVCIEKDN
jgi:hypothetical protein